MALTNNDGYNFINTILRKEKEGSALTPDRYNNMLNFSFWETLDDEYQKFEKDQDSTDLFDLLKRSEKVYFDGDGKFGLSNLDNTYWHTSSLYYDNGSNFVNIDVVSESQWAERLSSSLEFPSLDYPVCKISNDYLYVYPKLHVVSSSNVLSNCGYSGTTDWVDSNSDGLADSWSSEGSTYEILSDKYDFSGRSQGFSSDTLVSTPGVWNGYYAGGIVYALENYSSDKRYYMSFEYVLHGDDSDGTASISIENAVGTSPGYFVVSDVEFSFEKKYFSAYIQPDSDTLIRIALYNTTNNADKFLYVDNLFLAPTTSYFDVNFVYLKEPAQPYFDWYYDANDNIQYLEEDEQYTLQAGETYIDKDDGSTLTSGSVIGDSGDDAVNHTQEMEIPDYAKKTVFYSILSKFGIALDDQLAAQYSLSMEAKENTK